MLDAVLAVWASSNTYSTRVNNLRAALLVNGATVFDDGVADTLTGGLGMDWFFALPPDTTDLHSGELLN